MSVKEKQRYTGCKITIATPCPEDMVNASTKCVVQMNRDTLNAFPRKNVQK